MTPTFNPTLTPTFWVGPEPYFCRILILRGFGSCSKNYTILRRENAIFLTFDGGSKKGWSGIAEVEVRVLRLVRNNRGHRAHDAQPELVRGIGDGELLRRFRQQVLLAERFLFAQVKCGKRTSKVRSQNVRKNRQK